ncbi:DUF305 domain-containing protein [Psychromicrobium sp. YIM B11713]|uniref:DUF305 domain-containing protein n=1 Tax=Psychromicrobium sp. YIM B11713 TaxID=3145233 RepID=UPI00374EA32D
MNKKITLLSICFAAALGLAACSTGSAGSSMPGMDHSSTPMSSSSSPTKHNGADTMFAQMMIVHHQQAVEMSDTILAKAGIDQRVLDLAAAIKAAQGPEIAKMKTMLASWSEPEAMTGMMAMPGMMGDAEKNALSAATGTAATKLFLTQMIAHHQGAVESAKAERSDGQDSAAVQLAENIIKDQQLEIDKMKKILSSL